MWVMAMATSVSTSTFSSKSIQQNSSQIKPPSMHLKPPCALQLRKARGVKWAPGSCKRGCVLRAQGVESSAAGASTDSVVKQVSIETGMVLGLQSNAITADTKGRQPSPLKRGGTLTGDKASGKDPGLTSLGKMPATVGTNTGPFQDVRWNAGTWDLQQFTAPNGKVDWDAVIDAEVHRRKWLEDKPEASLNEDPVVFETSTIPWWAWMRRFHLPEAELLNGRAAMIGFFMGYVVDGLTGVGLVDQTNSFVGKLLLFVSVLGVLFIRKNEDVENLKQLVQEWNFYDNQWQASWQDEQAPKLKRKEQS